MQVSQKQKKFSEFIFAFLKSILNFKNFPQKITLTADVLPDILGPKNMIR